jgi:hypothetical protein
MRSKFTATERRSLVGAWQRSGVSARAFCEGRGIRPGTLYGWYRSYGQCDEAAPVRFVEVMAASEPERQASTGCWWRWELTGPGGSLRAADLDLAELGVLVEAMTRGGGR